MTADSSAEPPAPVLATRRIHEGRVLNLRVDEIEARDGGTRWVEVVEHAGGVGIIARPAPSTILLVRQYRHAVGERTWEVPAGMIDRHELPEVAAKREFEEETGYRTGRVRFLFSLYPSPGFLAERVGLYAADELSPGESLWDDDEVFDDVRAWDLDEAWSHVVSDEWRDAKTQIALQWALAERGR